MEVHMMRCVYWIPAFAGMTVNKRRNRRDRAEFPCATAGAGHLTVARAGRRDMFNLIRLLPGSWPAEPCRILVPPGGEPGGKCGPTVKIRGALESLGAVVRHDKRDGERRVE